MTQSLSKQNHVLNILQRSMYGCKKTNKTRAYLALVQPHLEYCEPVWCPHTTKDIEKIERVELLAGLLQNGTRTILLKENCL